MARASSVARKALAGVMLAPWLVLVAAVARLQTAWRHKTGRRPRLVWGPVPIINIKYWSEALRGHGYVSRTCVFAPYSIHVRSDFDLVYADFGASEVLQPYRAFIWALLNADVYLCFFDGGFLQLTALRDLELPLLRLAGMRIIASPYGSDVAVPGHLGVAEAPLLRDYPEIARHGAQVRRRVARFARYANVIVRNHQFGFLPRWDVLWPTQIAVDTRAWAPQGELGNADGQSGEVVVVHAPNHREIKGTQDLIDAVEQLQAEGLSVRLTLLERRPNTEVRQAIHKSDIVADQFIVGYALFAIEGMAAGRPVLSAISSMGPGLPEALARRGLPIVDADRSSLLSVLRELVQNPSRRRALGAAGRRFALDYHSYEATSAAWETIIQHVWSGTALPTELTAQAPPQRGGGHRQTFRRR